MQKKIFNNGSIKTTEQQPSKQLEQKRSKEETKFICYFTSFTLERERSKVKTHHYHLRSLK